MEKINICTNAGSEDLEAWLSRQATYPRRSCLPDPQQDRPNTISIIQLMKDVFGKHNLSRIPVPVQFHEPITELQQRAEDLQYSELLDKVSRRNVSVKVQASRCGVKCVLICCKVSHVY